MKPKLATRHAKKRAPEYASIDDISRNEVMAAIRDLYWEDPEPCDRENLLVLLRDHLHLGALGKNIRKELSGDVRAAVRRGVLDRRNGLYHRHCRNINQYEPTFLREMFLASLGDGRNPRGWIDQDEALVAAARDLGFRNTGTKIKRLFKNAIRALIRRGDLERDGQRIRRP